MPAARSMPRTLRSRRLRAYLWSVAEGRCQLCGKELGTDWQADHIVPWSTTGRTNVHEMQALCRACNQKKGNRMVQIARADLPENIAPGFRPGQKEALQVVHDRIIRREPYTTIVLPTRYGKTDVMRVAAVYLKQNDVIATSLVLTPSQQLRHQMVLKAKWQQCMDRTELRSKGKYLATELTQLPYDLKDITANDEVFVATTIQLVQQNIAVFCDWIDAVKARTGLPALVQVDEAHTGSEGNIWGDTIKRLVDRGALAALYTATPIRSDGRPIPGFPYTEILREEKTSTVVRKDHDRPEIRIIQKYATTRRIIKLEAHHETTFRQAWEESPSPLCKISRVAFDVNLLELGEHERDLWLADMTEWEVRQYRSRITRDPIVIERGVRTLIEKMDILRQSRSETAGIVFSGNDTDRASDKEVNEHAKQIKDAVLRLRPNWLVIIATAADSKDAERLINTFVEDGVGDVLIVKQMASLGLDCERLKVCLDLSPIRTHAAFIQRLTRIATRWGKFQHGFYITPDDIMGRELFRTFVEEQGGAAAATESILLDEKEVKVKEEEKPFIWIKGTRFGPMEDTGFQRAPATEKARVDAWTRRAPFLSLAFSDAEIAQGMPGWPPGEEPDGALFGEAIADPNLGEAIAEPNLTSMDDIEKERAMLLGLVKQIQTVMTGGYVKGDPLRTAEWVESGKQIYITIRQRAGLPPGVLPSRMRNLGELRRLQDAARELLSEVRNHVERVG